MATEAILADIGVLYKRLFNHRPLIQNEVHYFVKEFETKQEDADWKSLRDSHSKADEMYSVFLNEMMCSNNQFKTIQDKAQAVQNKCESILARQDTTLLVTPEEKEKLEHEVEELSGALKLKEWDTLVADEQELARLKEEIQEVRATRAKMRSVGSSVSSSITIYPPGTPSTSSPEDEIATEDFTEDAEGLQQGEEEHSQSEEDKESLSHKDSAGTLDSGSHPEQSLQADS